LIWTEMSCPSWHKIRHRVCKRGRRWALFAPRRVSALAT